MGFPVAPNVPVLMVALVPLKQSCQAGPLPPVAQGAAFWASARQAPTLAAAGQAIYAPQGTTPPPPEPGWTVNGQPGMATGTSNASH
jgi:hypothetical protein